MTATKIKNGHVLSLLVMGLLVGACANNETKNDESKTQDPSLYSMESSDTSQKVDDVLFDDDPAPSKETAAEAMPESSEPVAAEQSVPQSEPLSTEPAVAVNSDKMSVYRVQHDRETLMMIAFKIYGDYHRWREIAELNKAMFDERYVIKKGMMLKFAVPESEFKYEPKGEPFIIKWGDTLSSISKEVYDTLNRWKEIWHNNRPLIQNPNKIFAGFTIYYVPGEKVNGKKAKEVLPDLASSNPNQDQVEQTSQTPEPVDPKVELEHLETADSAGAEVPAGSESQVSQESDRNPTSL